MHRLWISLAVLITLTGAALFNTYYLSTLTEELSNMLLEAEACVIAGDWDAAIDKTEAALDCWTTHETYLHMVLQHADTDEVLLAFHEARQLLNTQEAGGEYYAANAKLITRIRLLSEMEQLNLKNLL